MLEKVDQGSYGLIYDAVKIGDIFEHLIVKVIPQSDHIDKEIDLMIQIKQQKLIGFSKIIDWGYLSPDVCDMINLNK